MKYCYGENHPELLELIRPVFNWLPINEVLKIEEVKEMYKEETDLTWLDEEIDFIKMLLNILEVFRLNAEKKHRELEKKYSKKLLT
jgi:hypothetical protein